MSTQYTDTWAKHQTKLEAMYSKATDNLKLSASDVLLQYKLGCYLENNHDIIDSKTISPFIILSFLESKNTFYRNQDYDYYIQKLKLQVIVKELHERLKVETKEDIKNNLMRNLNWGIEYIVGLEILRSRITDYLSLVASFRREIERFLLTYHLPTPEVD